MPKRAADVTAHNKDALRQARDLKAAADFLGTSTKTVRRRIAQGQLPAYRIAGSRAIRIYADDLVKLLAPIGGDAA